MPGLARAWTIQVDEGIPWQPESGSQRGGEGGYLSNVGHPELTLKPCAVPLQLEVGPGEVAVVCLGLLQLLAQLPLGCS